MEWICIFSVSAWLLSMVIDRSGQNERDETVPTARSVASQPTSIAEKAAAKQQMGMASGKHREIP
jgi:hypothetical protein